MKKLPQLIRAQEVQADQTACPLLVGNPESMDHPKDHLGGGFQYFLFPSLFGEDSHFD